MHLVYRSLACFCMFSPVSPSHTLQLYSIHHCESPIAFLYLYPSLSICILLHVFPCICMCLLIPYALGIPDGLALNWAFHVNRLCGCAHWAIGDDWHSPEQGLGWVPCKISLVCHASVMLAVCQLAVIGSSVYCLQTAPSAVNSTLSAATQTHARTHAHTHTHPTCQQASPGFSSHMTS